MQREQLKIRGRYSSLLWPALILLVSGCNLMGQNDSNQAQLTNVPEASGITPMALTILGDPGNSHPKFRKGRPANMGLSNGKYLENSIKDFADLSADPPANLKQRIAKMRIQNLKPINQVPNSEVRGFTGLGGVFTHEFLDIADEAVATVGNGGSYINDQYSVITAVEGQIIDYGYVAANGSGHLEVITAITSRKVLPAQANPIIERTVGYKWKISVDPGGFQVIDHSNDDTDPFQAPGMMEFSQSMKDRIKSLGFRHKLWALGEKIKVLDVHRAQNFTWQSPTWVRLQENNAKWKRLYQSDDKSCIDMMFVDTPPATFDDLEGPPWYCLGRCAHPGIVNSR